ncbi:MAG: hypothetical protein SH817_12245 [Leptospira sp.]|nr:hypothetical protein [Leptospira sp.]
MILPFLNAILTLYFIKSEDFESIEFLYYIIIILFVYSIFSVIFNFFRNKLEIFSNIDLSLFTSLLIFSFFEILFILTPSLFPSSIRNYAGESIASKNNQGVIEYFDHTPYAKFKPNSVIQSAGDYGPPEKFAYSWMTDRFGFKNLETIANQENISVLAVGDSFTEGMGVKVENTYPSILTELGIPTYNLGVQGSAPIQWMGYLEMIGKNFKPKLVIVGYLPTVYEREGVFLNRDDKNRALPSALGRISKLNRKHEIRNQKKFLISGLTLFAVFNLIPEIKEFLQPIINKFDTDLSEDPRYIDTSKLVKSDKIKISKMARYIKEFKRVEQKGLTKEEIEVSPEWKSFEKQILEIQKKTKAIGSNFLLLTLPHRDLVYYEIATGLNPPSYNFSSIEIELIKEFSKRNNILTFDVTPIFVKYSNGLREDTPLDEYPYLEIDGHLNARGNRLLAESIKTFIVNSKLLR